MLGKYEDVLSKDKLHTLLHILENMDNTEDAIEQLEAKFSDFESTSPIMMDIKKVLDGPMQNTYANSLSTAMNINVDYVVGVV